METFERLRTALTTFIDEPLLTADFERAARMANTCRAAGVQGSPTDFTLCAVSERLDAPIFTSDGDFLNYAKQLTIVLYQP